MSLLVPLSVFTQGGTIGFPSVCPLRSGSFDHFRRSLSVRVKSKVLFEGPVRDYFIARTTIKCLLCLRYLLICYYFIIVDILILVN